MAPAYPIVCRGKVTAVLNDVGTVVKLEIPDLAPGVQWGPIESTVDGLAVGEWVLTVQVGFARDARVIIGRTQGRRSRIDEVVGLGDALGELVTRLEYADVTDRVDSIAQLLDETRFRLDDDVVLLERVRSEVSGLRQRLAALSDAIDTNRGNVTTNQAAITAMQAALYGSTDRVAGGIPQAEIRLGSDATGLAANTDYIFSTLYTVFRDTEKALGKTPIITIGTSASDPTRMRVPFDGDWTLEISARTTNTTGISVIKALLNADASTTASARIQAATWASAPGLSTPEGTPIMFAKTGRFSTGDVLTFGVWGNVAYTLSSVYLGANRTRIRLKYSPT